MNPQLEIKNKITYLHNNLKEGETQLINGKSWIYVGFLPAVKGGKNAHNFHRNGEKLVLDREDLICLDCFNEVPKNAFEKYYKEQGYEINFEFCGYPEKRPVLRFRGEFICSQPTIEQAEKEIIFHDAEHMEKINNIKLI